MYNPDDFATSPHRAPRLNQYDTSFSSDTSMKAVNAIPEVIDPNKIPYDQQYGWVEAIRRGDEKIMTCGENIAQHKSKGYNFVNSKVHPEYICLPLEEEDDLLDDYSRKNSLDTSKYERSTRGSSKIFKGTLALMQTSKLSHEAYVRELNSYSQQLNDSFEEKNFNSRNMDKIHMQTTTTYE